MNQVKAEWALVAIAAVQVVTSAAMLGAGHREVAMRRVLPYLVSGAAGVLLATACLDLLPDAVRDGGPGPGIWVALLGTLLALFVLQSFAHLLSEGAANRKFLGGEAHTHGMGEALPRIPGDVGRRTAPGTLLLGSALHSTVDGVAIAAAFTAGWRPGWGAALAVGLHELPHRLGDFALLLHLGVPRAKAAGAAIGAGAMALVGAAAVTAFGHSVSSARWLLPVSAGSFLYIALVDLLPEMHAARRSDNVWGQILCLCGGAVLIALLAQVGGEGL